MISNASCWYSWCHISPDLCYAICHCYFYNGSILASVCNMWSMSVGMFIWLLVSISMHSAFLKWLSRLSKAHNDSKRSMHIFSWHDICLYWTLFPTLDICDHLNLRHSALVWMLLHHKIAKDFGNLIRISNTHKEAQVKIVIIHLGVPILISISVLIEPFAKDKNLFILNNLCCLFFTVSMIHFILNNQNKKI